MICSTNCCGWWTEKLFPSGSHEMILWVSDSCSMSWRRRWRIIGKFGILASLLLRTWMVGHRWLHEFSSVENGFTIRGLMPSCSCCQSEPYVRNKQNTERDHHDVCVCIWSLRWPAWQELQRYRVNWRLAARRHFSCVPFNAVMVGHHMRNRDSNPGTSRLCRRLSSSVFVCLRLSPCVSVCLRLSSFVFICLRLSQSDWNLSRGVKENVKNYKYVTFRLAQRKTTP